MLCNTIINICLFEKNANMESEAGFCILEISLYFKERDFHNGGHLTHKHTTHWRLYFHNPETVFERLLIHLLPPCESRDTYMLRAMSNQGSVH